MVYDLSCSVVRGTFLDHGSNPCISRQILNPWVTREVQVFSYNYKKISTVQATQPVVLCYGSLSRLIQSVAKSQRCNFTITQHYRCKRLSECLMIWRDLIYHIAFLCICLQEQMPWTAVMPSRSSYSAEEKQTHK